MNQPGTNIECTPEGEGWRIQLPRSKWWWLYATVLVCFGVTMIVDIGNAPRHALRERLLFAGLSTAGICFGIALLVRRVAIVLTPAEILVEQAFFSWKLSTRVRRSEVRDLRFETSTPGRKMPTGLYFGEGRTLASNIPDAAAQDALEKLLELDPAFGRHSSGDAPEPRASPLAGISSPWPLRIERSGDRLRIALPYQPMQLVGLPALFVFSGLAFVLTERIVRILEGAQKTIARAEIPILGFFVALGVLGFLGNLLSLFARTVLTITPSEIEVQTLMGRRPLRRFDRGTVRNLRVLLSGAPPVRGGIGGSIRFETPAGEQGFGSALSARDAEAIRSALRGFAPEILAPGEA
jgi:hypothetical protein